MIMTLMYFREDEALTNESKSVDAFSGQTENMYMSE